METERPKTLEGYIKAMKERNVEVIPSINKGNKLQGFRFQYHGHNFKASEVHRSMSGGRIMAQLSQNNGITKPIKLGKTVNLLGKTIGNEYKSCIKYRQEHHQENNQKGN